MGIQDANVYIDPLKKLPAAELDMSTAGQGQWAGNRIGVDMSGLLHKAILPCAQELCSDDAPLEVRHKNYVTSRLMSLVDAGWRPVAVFEGAEIEADFLTKLVLTGKFSGYMLEHVVRNDIQLFGKLQKKPALGTSVEPLGLHNF